MVKDEMKSTVKVVPRCNVGGGNDGVLIESNLLRIFDLSTLYILQVINKKLNDNYNNNKCIRDNRVWMHHSIDDFQHDEFYYCSTNTVKRKLDELIKNGILIRSNKYNKFKFDRTYWYTIDYDAIDKLKEQIKKEENNGR